jgi:uncharacterized protein
MKNHLHSLIIAAAILLTALIFSHAYRNRHQAGHSISVTGLGSKDFVADLIVWSGSFSRKHSQLKEAYAALDSDREKITAYVIAQGIPKDAIIFSAVDINKEFDYQYDNNGNLSRSVFSGYSLRQSIQIESRDVDKIEALSRKVTELINSGIELYSNQPEYYYTKLAELKIEMIAEATKDAQLRASQIADNAGGSLGKLKRADMGVFQIVAQNSSEEYSWGGSFNTSSKRKTASITVKLEYSAH